MTRSKIIVTFVSIVPLLLVNSKIHSANNCQDLATVINKIQSPKLTSQIVLVESLGGYKVIISACHLQGATWRQEFAQPFHGVIGKEGIAPMGAKKEGDLKTPAGLYPIGTVFGSQPLAMKMDFKYSTSIDKFIDDVHSKYYNTWVSGPTDAKSYEKMLIAPYKIGAVINYNMNPTIPGAGSAIFMHLWESKDTPTVGCIAMNEKNLLTILHWLDKKQHPYIYIH